MIETDRFVSPEIESPREVQHDRAIRPVNLAEYIGQPIVKEKMEIFLGAARKREEPLDHTLILGPQGWVKQPWQILLPMKWV
jgi:Holliday junction DNA helicase RuvB